MVQKKYKNKLISMFIKHGKKNLAEKIYIKYKLNDILYKKNLYPFIICGKRKKLYYCSIKFSILKLFKNIKSNFKEKKLLNTLTLEKNIFYENNKKWLY